MVEDNIRLAALRRSEDAGVGPRRAVANPWPVITISREPAAGGTTLARSVAAVLGYACWDQELLTRIAERSGEIESVIAEVDERVNSSVSEFIRTLMVGLVAQDDYRAVLTKVVESIADQGAAVIVGRGGHFILGGRRALRVRVVCDRAERVRRMMQRDNVGESVAARRIRDMGAGIAQFMRHHFHRDVTDPHHYDVVVNTGSLAVAQATNVVVGAYAARFGRLPQPISAGPASGHRAVADLSRAVG
jgi:cytidylate kinase